MDSQQIESAVRQFIVDNYLFRGEENLAAEDSLISFSRFLLLAKAFSQELTTGI